MVINENEVIFNEIISFWVQIAPKSNFPLISSRSFQLSTSWKLGPIVLIGTLPISNYVPTFAVVIFKSAKLSRL